MKLRIIDLMDYYQGNPSVPLTPYRKTAVHRAGEFRNEEKRAKAGRIKQGMMAAACLVMIVALTAFSLWVSPLLQPTWGSAAAEGSSPAMETFGNSVSTSDDAAEASDETTPALKAVPELVQPIVLEGAEDYEICYGNLFYMNGAYYSVGDNGPEQIETENLHTTVELYGSWEVDIDYAVIDDLLVFHDNGENTGSSSALVLPLPGSVDTVILQIVHTSESFAEGSCYLVLYNIFTGQISDPLANIPSLFDYGKITSVIFNADLSRAIVNVSTASQGLIVDNWGSQSSYICDFNTTTMTPISQLIDISQDDTPASIENGYCQWVDNDIIAIWVMEVTSTDDMSTSYETNLRMYSYNLGNSSLCGELRADGAVGLEYPSSGCSMSKYIYDTINGGSGYRIIDGTNCMEYFVAERDDFAAGALESHTENRCVLYLDVETIYLIDNSDREWIKISNYFNVIPSDVQFVSLITDEWLCIGTCNQAYLYNLPEGIIFTQWSTEN